MRLRLTVLSALILSAMSFAQDLTPRAYVITPVSSNAIVLSTSFFDGDILFAGTVPITDSSGKVYVSTLSLYHALNFFGRSANATASLPYAIGNFRGKVIGAEHNAYRSGLVDTIFRFSVNLMGGPALSAPKFRSWKQKTLIGASLKMVAPTGQYDPSKLINSGGNRWVFKPELGLSRRWGHWIVDAYGGVVFFTENHDFFSRNQSSVGTNTQSQKPVGAFEGHLSYDVRPRLWASLDGNFWRGGRTSINGVENPGSLQSNSRVGGTASVPVSRRQS
ncbi:MAG TPA: transporter, partial [Terriglobales bacterium]|nr:transporter [Terriglobales bacterium]